LAGTTIARTVAYEYSKQRRLGASFFFSRGGGDVSHAGKFFTSIAVQLANMGNVNEVCFRYYLLVISTTNNDFIVVDSTTPADFVFRLEGPGDINAVT
jgi:hypothetical protein